jgi:hypothetical protein
MNVLFVGLVERNSGRLSIAPQKTVTGARQGALARAWTFAARWLWRRRSTLHQLGLRSVAAWARILYPEAAGLAFVPAWPNPSLNLTFWGRRVLGFISFSPNIRLPQNTG